MKFIDASSSDPYKKAAREELESDNPDENKNERTDRLQRINKKPITQKSINPNPVIPSFKKLISIKPKAKNKSLKTLKGYRGWRRRWGNGSWAGKRTWRGAEAWWFAWGYEKI